MTLPLTTSYAPMEALRIPHLPTGPEWQFEPKWDGFRCLAFRDGKSIELRSKNGLPLERYFPELAAALLGLKPNAYVLDGEIVVPVNGQLSFEALLLRIHPSANRVNTLAAQTPAIFVVFDLLTDEKRRPLNDLPLLERRAKLDAFARKYFKAQHDVVLSPMTRDRDTAQGWFSHVGSGMDGVIAKRLDLPYESGNRNGMVKVKRVKSADCVVGGFRYGTNSKVVGSLLLGLYDDNGLLNHVGFTSTFKAAERPALTAKVEPLIKPPGFTGNAPGGPSRWNTARSADWQPLKSTLVVEVQYDHFTGGRFRHGTRFLRWRPDKAPKQCLLSQVEHDEKGASLELIGAS